MKYLLTGGSGVLGTEIQKHLDCWAPSRKVLDITRLNDEDDKYGYSYKYWFEEYNHKDLVDINTLIHCAAYTDVPHAEIEKDKAVLSNIIGTYNVANYAHKYGWKVVYISTDYVYNGISGNHKETDITNPINWYASTKLAGESFMVDDDLIIRTSFKPRNLWTDRFYRAFSDVYTSADYADVIAKKICDLIGSGEQGIFNVGTERKSIYDLAKQTNPDVKPMSRKEIRDVRLPEDISMCINKYERVLNER